jgi:predicted MFS family arabinose efflux permease
LTFFGAWASFVFIPLSARLVEALGWRQALLVLAAILGVLTILPHALLLRRRPQDLGLLPDGEAAPVSGSVPSNQAEPGRTSREALREGGFWWLSFAFAVSTFSGVALTVHLIPYLVSRGHPPGFAATVAGLFGLMSLAGRLLIGPLGDRFPRRLVTAGLMAMQVAALVVLALTPTVVGALVYVALFGAGSGTMTIMRAALLAERYGAANYGSIQGAQSFVLTGAKTLAPLGAGLLAVALGGYPALLLALAALSAAGLVALLQVRDHIAGL